MMRIGVVTAEYSASGVPIAQARLAVALARAGHKVDYIVGKSFQNIEVPEPKGTKRLLLGAQTVRSMLRPLYHYMRDTRPDLIFCAEDHLNATVAIAALMASSKVKISGSSRITPFDAYSTKLFSKRWILKKVVRATAWRQNVRTCVSSGMVDEYKKVMPGLNYSVAYNIVVSPEEEQRKSAPLKDPWLPLEGRAGDQGSESVVLAAGSLEPWKDFESLIRAIHLLHNKGRKVRLIILGEGSQRSILTKLIADLNIGEWVRLHGYEENPSRYFRRASAFALSSRVESFGNVIVEAMFAGATPVATDCPTGPREVLADGRFGYLVRPGDPNSIADGIAAALDQPISLELLLEGVSRFKEEAVLQRHEDLLGIPLLSDKEMEPRT